MKKLILVIFISAMIIVPISVYGVNSSTSTYSASNTYVYISSQTSYYHTSYCKYDLNPTKVSLEYALYLGLNPCPYCNPDVAINSANATTDYSYVILIMVILGVVAVLSICFIALFIYNKEKTKFYTTILHEGKLHLESEKEILTVDNNKDEKSTNKSEQLNKKGSKPQNQNTVNLPMNWYNFWLYFKLPLGIIFEIIRTL